MALQNSRARRRGNNNNNRLYMIIGIGVLLLSVAAYFLLKPAAKKPKKRPAAVRPAGKVAVPLLNKNLKLNRRITQKDITVNFYQPLEVPEDAVLSPKKFLNRRATRPLYRGDYIKSADVTAQGAPRGLSGLAQPNKRVVVIPASLFPGSLMSMNVGDHVDILAIGSPRGTGVVRSNTGKKKRFKNFGGSQPGAGGRPNRGRKKQSKRVVAATTATLIAEDAEIIAKPSRKPGRNFVIFQMNPQDAHITMLAASSGAVMRHVFRPYTEDTRLTVAKGADITTRPPRVERDPDAITVISGGDSRLRRPMIRQNMTRSIEAVETAAQEGMQVIEVN